MKQNNTILKRKSASVKRYLRSTTLLFTLVLGTVTSAQASMQQFECNDFQIETDGIAAVLTNKHTEDRRVLVPHNRIPVQYHMEDTPDGPFVLTFARHTPDQGVFEVRDAQSSIMIVQQVCHMT